jgi:hypothetical protein
MPGTAAALADTYLLLLVRGIDHSDVGTQLWVSAICLGARMEPTVRGILYG